MVEVISIRTPSTRRRRCRHVEVKTQGRMTKSCSCSRMYDSWVLTSCLEVELESFIFRTTQTGLILTTLCRLADCSCSCVRKCCLIIPVCGRFGETVDERDVVSTEPQKHLDENKLNPRGRELSAQNQNILDLCGSAAAVLLFWRLAPSLCKRERREPRSPRLVPWPRGITFAPSSPRKTLWGKKGPKDTSLVYRDRPIWIWSNNLAAWRNVIN